MLSTENKIIRRVCVEWMHTEHCWNDTAGVKSKKTEKTLQNCLSDHHKSHTDCTGRKSVPPRWKTSE